LSARNYRALAAQPYRNALVVTSVAVLLGSLFAASYALALARPTPHHIPAGLVGSSHGALPVMVAFERSLDGELAFRPYASEASAARAIDEQDIYAALVPHGKDAQLLLSSASGASVVRVLEHAASELSAGSPVQIAVVDLHPLPAGDPQGLVAFYVTLAATLIGIVTMIQLSVNARGLSLRAWLAFTLLAAASMGLALAFVTGPLIGALSGPFLELAAALGAEVLVAALVTSMLIVLLARWAIVPAWLLFVVLGNTSSGGAVAPPLLPGLYRFIGRFLPPGATVETVRTAVYFRHYQHAAPMLIEAAWLIGGLLALLLAVRLRGTGPAMPADPPAAPQVALAG